MAGTEVATASVIARLDDAMTTPLGRRRHPRYLLANPVDGSLRICDEVVVEALDEREALVLSSEPCRPDERLMLEVPGPPRQRVSVRVTESRPAVVADGIIRHRLRLMVEPQPAEREAGGGTQR